MQRWLKKSGVQIFHFDSGRSSCLSQGGKISGVRSREGIYPCDAAVLATGGASYPATGSSGDGYSLAAELGHRIVEPRPALIPLVTGGLCRPNDRLHLRNVGVRLLINGKRVRRFFGELVFMDYGVSGPVILTMSQQVWMLFGQGNRSPCPWI